MSTAAEQPRCAKCRAVLPWQEVDRGSGRCPACQEPFDFSIPPATEPPRFPDEPAKAGLFHELSVPLALVPRPFGVVVRAEAPRKVVAQSYRVAANAGLRPIEIAYRPWGGLRAVVPTAFASCGVISFAMWRRMSAGAAGVPVLAASVLICFGVAYLMFRHRVRVVADAKNLRVERFRHATFSVAVGDIVRFGCEDSSPPIVSDEPRQRMFHVVAFMRDGTPVRLVADVVGLDVAFHITQVLRDWLDAGRTA